MMILFTGILLRPKKATFEIFYQALDHLRILHFDNGQDFRFVISEGYGNIAIFSFKWWLFAKLLGSKQILSLIKVCVLLIIAAKAHVKLNTAFFIHLLFLLPTLPNGGWSITVEYFYLIWLLITATKFPNVLMFSLIVFIGARVGPFYLATEPIIAYRPIFIGI